MPMDMIEFLEPMYRNYLLKTYGKTEKQMKKSMLEDGMSEADIDEHMNELYKNFVSREVRLGGI